MVKRLYLGDAFGWDTEYTAKVAIAQLREAGNLNLKKCPRAQLIKNESFRWMPNALKVLGYIPGINVIAGIVAIVKSERDSDCGPNHTARWIGRGVAMILTGPLLIIADLIGHISDRKIANKYCKEHVDAIKAFDTTHKHTAAFYPGHPIFCK